MGGVRSNDYKLNKSWPNRDNSILFEDLWFVETPPPMGGGVGGSVGQWVGSGQMTNNWINLDLIKIIQLGLKIYDLLRHPHPWVGVWVVGWVSGWLGGFRSNDLQLNKSWPNRDNSIGFEDLWFVETAIPMDGCVAGWLGQFVNGWGQVKWLTIE